MSYLLARLYDRALAGVEDACLRAWRQELLRHARGDVLEIGAGTGANLNAYPDGIGRLVLTEPDAAMRDRLLRKAPDAELVACAGESLPFPTRCFDTVVCTLVLCSVDAPARAVSEMARVLRPGGRLLFIEHVAAADGSARRRWQARIEPLWRRLLGNCHLTRDTEALLHDPRLVIETIHRQSMRAANPLVRPSIRGVARRI